MQSPGFLVILCGLALAGCGDWPNVVDPGGNVTSGDWPKLQPLGDLGGPPGSAWDESVAFQSLETRAAQLRLRAAILSTPLTDQDSFDRLRTLLSQ